MKRIAVLMGGKSTEHEISLLTGIFIYKTLPRNKYLVKAIPIDKNGNWIIPKSFENNLPEPDISGQIYSDKFAPRFELKNEVASNRSISLENLNCDIVFLGLHGGEGEDGTIQGLLKSHGIPFTGSGVLASALAMDKNRSNMLFQNIGLNVARFREINRHEFLREDFQVDKIDLTFPVFVKPTFGGSSVGVGKVNSIIDLKIKLQNLFQKEDKILIQEFVEGREISCGVIEKKVNGRFTPFALPATEIIPKNDFFDYESKYTVGGSNEITPAQISDAEMKKIQESALLAHNILGCVGYSRTDFIIHSQIPFILETNTLPGMTATSILPQQAKCIGLKMEDLLDSLVERALGEVHVR